MINLCCAQSVHRVVEEVARSLERLGFGVTVVCGAEARAALLGSRTDSEQPTIHVVCVQGSMQERVLKPLRQALATHGGPNHHLFVAVLDLAVPLAMVGQIRRFAEALERSAPLAPTGGEPGVIPVGREPSAAHRLLEQSPTRSYPSVTQVVERGGTKPPLAPAGEGEGERPPRRTRPLGARPPVANIAPTSKYQAVTATHPVVPEPSVRKRRRERSRLRPSARRPRATDERVLGLPEQDVSRRTAGPRREPPPPPAPGKLAHRRSPTPPPTASASLPPPPPPPGRAKPPASAEPDRLMPRLEAGFRFTPPGVKAADLRRPQSGPFPVASLSEMRRDPDKTLVMAESHGVEEPRTASTLRLDEPPFAAGAAARPELRGQRDAPASSQEEEPVEPTMIIATPTDPAAAEVVEDEAIEELTEEAVEPTAVGPTPTPRAVSLERAHVVVSESSRTLVHHPTDAEPATGAVPPRALVQRPVGAAAEAPLSSESSGTLVLRPRSAALEDEPLVVRAPAASEGPTGTVVQAAPTHEGAPVSESAKTLLRGDGTFPRSRELMQKVAASQPAKAAAPSRPIVAPTPEPAPREPVAAEPAFKAGKTVLYADSSSVPAAASAPEAAAKGATVVGPAPTTDEPEPTSAAKGATVVGPAPTTAGEPEPTAAAKGATVVGPAPTTGEPEPASAERDADAPAVKASEPGASPSARRPSAIPTERHPLATHEPEPSPSRPPRGRKRALEPRTGVLEDRSTPPAAVVTRERALPRDPARRPRPKQSSRYGWLWILLALLTAGGGWGAYQAGLLDGVLGRSRSPGSTVADASTKGDPNAGAASRTSAEAGIAEAGIASTSPASTGPTSTGPASTGPDDTGPTTEDDAVEPAAATAAATTTATTGDTDDPTSRGDAPEPSTGEPEPAAGSTTTGADAPAADDGTPDAPAADDGTPDAPAADDGTPDAPPVVDDGPQLSADEQQLTPAVEARRIFMLKSLFATKRQGTATSFAGAWQRCAKLEVDGVKGWRLPHRREMKLVNAVLNLPAGAFWTRTVPPEDKTAAYVLDSSNGQLSLFLKQEPNGEVVCVRERAHPDE